MYFCSRKHIKEMKVLIVDDEQDICNVIDFYLGSEGYETQSVGSAEEALKLDLPSFDIVLLDVMLDGMSGFDMAARLRSDKRTAHIPIIFITAMGQEEYVVRGLDLGADDYVTKPLSLRELSSRIRTVMRRCQPQQTGKDVAQVQVLRYETLEVDMTHNGVSIDGCDVELTRLEYSLLVLLLQHPGRYYERQELITKCWPQDAVVMERSVDVTITRIRKKLGRYADCVRSRTGFGYTFAKKNDISNS